MSSFSFAWRYDGRQLRSYERHGTGVAIEGCPKLGDGADRRALHRGAQTPGAAPIDGVSWHVPYSMVRMDGGIGSDHTVHARGTVLDHDILTKEPWRRAT